MSWPEGARVRWPIQQRIDSLAPDIWGRGRVASCNDGQTVVDLDDGERVTLPARHLVSDPSWGQEPTPPPAPRLVASPSGVLAWIAKMEVYGRALRARPCEDEAALAAAQDDLHRWYLVLFRGFAKAFHSEGGATAPLNLNVVASRGFMERLDGSSRHAVFVATVDAYMAALALARAVAQGHRR